MNSIGAGSPTTDSASSRIPRPASELPVPIPKAYGSRPRSRIFGSLTTNSGRPPRILKARYSSQCGNKRQTKKRLLSGLVKCGACGGSMTIVNRERYSCSAKRERGTCDSPAGISAVALEETGAVRSQGSPAWQRNAHRGVRRRVQGRA